MKLSSLPSSILSLVLLYLHDAYNVAAQSAVTDYAPATNVECPDLSTTNFLREFTPQNQTLHPDEQAYVDTRSTTVLPDAWAAWLGW